jgi:hypothetical protein
MLSKAVYLCLLYFLSFISSYLNMYDKEYLGELITPDGENMNFDNFQIL